MRYEIRPLGRWDGPVTFARAGSGRFRAGWQSTLDLLASEVDHLGGDLIVLQVDVLDGDLRRDGMLRTNARVDFPGVRISFESRHGPLTYATDVYEATHRHDPPGWQANARAIALALQALRAVDRYGVTRSGEQYRGWTAIEARAAADHMTREQAANLLAGAPGAPYTAKEILRNSAAVLNIFRWLARQHHPDVGGDPELFRRCVAARDILIGQQ